MKFSKKSLRMAGLLLGVAMLGSVFAGCGDEAKSDEINPGVERTNCKAN